MAGHEATNVNHRRVQGIDAAGHDGLQGGDEISTGDNGIHGLVGMAAMAAFAFDDQLKGIRGGMALGMEQPGRAHVQTGRDMAGQHAVHMGVVQRTLFNHQIGAAIALLGRLEKQLDVAGQVLDPPAFHQVFGHAEHDGGVGVMGRRHASSPGFAI